MKKTKINETEAHRESKYNTCMHAFPRVLYKEIQKKITAKRKFRKGTTLVHLPRTLTSLYPFIYIFFFLSWTYKINFRDVWTIMVMRSELTIL